MKHDGKYRLPAVGEIVIVKSDEKNRGTWRMGKVVKVIPGVDGVVRGAKVRVGYSELERPVQHLFPLELSCDAGTKKESGKLNASATEFRPRSKRQAANQARHGITAIGFQELDD